MAEVIGYSPQELQEFKEIILKNLEKAKSELDAIVEALQSTNDNAASGIKNVNEDGAELEEYERLSQLAVRQKKFIGQLENALLRVNNGTYGICIDTGTLIDKERLKLVPHTMHSLAAKLMAKDSNK